MIKKTILDLGTKFDRLEVHDIAEKCDAAKGTIIEVIQEMIKNDEIYAEYFRSSNTVAFNQQANIEEIDNLMAIYKKWEEENVGKKVK